MPRRFSFARARASRGTNPTYTLRRLKRDLLIEGLSRSLG